MLDLRNRIVVVLFLAVTAGMGVLARDSGVQLQAPVASSCCCVGEASEATEDSTCTCCGEDPDEGSPPGPVGGCHCDGEGPGIPPAVPAPPAGGWAILVPATGLAQPVSYPRRLPVARPAARHADPGPPRFLRHCSWLI